jgi:predicted Zn finger-like uncharacterized protein
MKCPRCGQPRLPEERECSNCGTDFSYVAQKLARSPRNGETTAPQEPAASESEAAETPDAANSDPATVARADATAKPDGTDTAATNAPPDDKLKPCPKCGYHNTVTDLECLRCGIIFAKYEAFLEKRRKAEETNQTTDSLLDQETIRTAAEASQQAPPKTVYAKTACPHCAQRYRIRHDQIGILTRCKKCSSIFKIEPLPNFKP